MRLTFPIFEYLSPEEHEYILQLCRASVRMVRVSLEPLAPRSRPESCRTESFHNQPELRRYCIKTGHFSQPVSSRDHRQIGRSVPDTRGGKVIAGIHQGRVLLSLLLLLVAWSAIQLRDLGVDNSVEVWFPSSDPALIEYRAFQDFLAMMNKSIIGVQTSVPLLSVEGLELTKTLTEQVEQVEGIASAVSITNLPVIDDASTAFNVQSIEEMGCLTRRFSCWYGRQSKSNCWAINQT